MNAKHAKKILTLLFLSSTVLGFTQTGTAKLVSLKKEKKITKTISSKSGYAYTKKVPALYSGYVVELTTSDLPLTKDEIAFKYFGKIYHDKTSEGYYSYFILADFNKKESVEEYVRNIVAHRVPLAKIIEYKNGQRKNTTTKKERKFRMVD